MDDSSEDSASLWVRQGLRENKIEGSWLEVMRDRIFDLHFYVMYTGASSFLLAFLLRCYFFISFVIFGMLPLHGSLWDGGTLFRKVFVMFSHFVCFNCDYKTDAFVWMSVGLLCAIALIGVFFVVSVFVHQMRRTKLYIGLHFFSIFSVVMPIIIQFFAAHTGIYIGLWVSGSQQQLTLLVGALVIIVFVILCLSYSIFVAPEIVFRPRILTFYSPSHGSMLFVFYYLFIIMSVAGSVANLNVLCFLIVLQVVLMAAMKFIGDV